MQSAPMGRHKEADNAYSTISMEYRLQYIGSLFQQLLLQRLRFTYNTFGDFDSVLCTIITGKVVLTEQTATSQLGILKRHTREPSRAARAGGGSLGRAVTF